MPVPPATRSARPLATIDRPIRARIYRARLRPFQSTKYLDAKVLRKVRKATIEIGTLEAPGMSCPVAAEIRRGLITSLRPVGCAGSKPTRISAAKQRLLLAEVTRRVQHVRPQLRLPTPVHISRTRGLGLTIGPIVIICDPDVPCIWVWVGSSYCLFCTFGWVCG